MGKPHQNFVSAVLFQTSALEHRRRSPNCRGQFFDKAVISIWELLDFNQLLLQDAPPHFMKPASYQIASEAALYPFTACVFQTMTL